MKLTRSCFGGTAGKGKSFPARTRPCRGFFGGRRFFAGGPYPRALPIGGRAFAALYPLAGGPSPLPGPSQAGFFRFSHCGRFLAAFFPRDSESGRAKRRGRFALRFGLMVFSSLNFAKLFFNEITFIPCAPFRLFEKSLSPAFFEKKARPKNFHSRLL